MANALVIGGTAFIGIALVEQLLERGDTVTIMHRSRGTSFGDRVREIRCDRGDTDAVRSALRDKTFDVVYDNVYDWQHGTSAEQVAAAALAAAEGLQRYVFISSVAAYGFGMDHDEDGPLAPADHPNPYMRHKANTERELFRLHREHGLPVTTVRPAFVYGPHNPFDRESFFWDRLLADRPIIIPEDGTSLMQFVIVEDVARALILSTTNEDANGQAFNLANEPITQLDFVTALAQTVRKEPRFVFIPRDRLLAAGGGLMEPPLYFGAFLDLPPLTVRNDRVQSLLGLEPTPFDEGLRRTFEWYRTQDRPAVDYSWEDGVMRGTD